MEKNSNKNKIICSGALFYSKQTYRCLFLQKSRGKHQGTWGLVGGTNLQNENPWQGLQREIIEELSFFPEIIKTIPLETFVSNDNIFNFHTYLCVIDSEFIPQLSSEHCGWSWASIELAPRPLHQGLRNSFSNKTVQLKLTTIFEIIELI